MWGWEEGGSGEWTLEGLNEHWNAGSAVKRSNDKKQNGGWLLWNKRRGGDMQGSSGVDLQEPRNVALLCNHEAARTESTDDIPEKTTYSKFSVPLFQNALILLAGCNITAISTTCAFCCSHSHPGLSNL